MMDGSVRRRGRDRWVAAAATAAALGALLFVANGCDSILGPSGDRAPREPITELPRSLTAAELQAIGASNRFGLELLQRMAEADPGATVFLSPLSASMALGMTLNGADGATYDGMRTALRLGEASQEEINEAYLGLLELLEALDPEVSLRVANSVWYRPDYTVVPAFRERIQTFFRGAVHPFAAENPEDAINAWVREATEGRIDEIAPSPLPANVVAFLLNGVHFQADWTEPFDPDDTAPAPFHLLDGSTAQVQLMSRDDTVSVHLTGSYAAVDLPYARQAFSMTVVVPRGERTVYDLLAELADEGWGALVAGLETSRAQVSLPRFELEWEGELDEPLKDMGMALAFAPGADFSRMFEGGGPWIGQVKQKSFLKVDEEGTEAAAVTSVVMTDSAPPTVRADRPFLLVIRERLSGTILFAGAIVEAPLE